MKPSGAAKTRSPEVRSWRSGGDFKPYLRQRRRVIGRGASIPHLIQSRMTDLFQAAGLTPEAPRPLADRLRPTTLAEVVGQEHLLGPEGPIGRMAAAHRLSSMILWGPPGVGKTTIARLLADASGYQFQQLSAVFSGVADLKKAFETARTRRAAGGRRPCCSWTRFTASIGLSRTGFLPFVEAGRRDAGGRHHREPVLRAERGAPLPLSGLCAAAPRRQGVGDPAPTGGGQRRPCPAPDPRSPRKP